ncbi:hypothetical protein MKW92_044885, partial [Papaver armeniacum]
MEILMNSHNEHSVAIKVLGGPVDFSTFKRAIIGRLFPIQVHHIETSSTLHVIQMSLKLRGDKEFILANQPWTVGPHV